MIYQPGSGVRLLEYISDVEFRMSMNFRYGVLMLTGRMK